MWIAQTEVVAIMRYVDRTRAPIPQVLTSDRARYAVNEVHRFIKRTDSEIAQRRSPFDESLIYNGEVRDALRTLFADKCAYCESRSYYNEMSTEQLRPRRLSDRREDITSHYAWLSYDWENLYWVCADCSKRKGARFPVDGQLARPFSTVSEARSTERARFIDPCFDDPRAHLRLSYDGDYLTLSEKGTETLNLLDLNRPALRDARQETIRQLHHLLDLGLRRDLSTNELAESIRTALSPNAPFSGAAIQYFGTVIEFATGKHPRWSTNGPTMNRVLEDLFLIDPTAIQRGVGRASEEIGKIVPRRYIPEEEFSDTTASTPAASAAVREIEIVNFKGINQIKLTIPPYRRDRGSAGALMLLGENAAGKSSVLEAVALAMLGHKEAAKLIPAENLLRRKGDTRLELVETEPAAVRIDFYDRREPAILNVDPLERKHKSNPQPRSVVIGYGPRRYSEEGKSWTRSRSARVRGLFRPTAPLADPVNWLRYLADHDPVRFNAIARGLREILALRESDNLILDSEMGVCVSVHGRLEPVSKLSEGYRSLFAMAVDMMRELLQDQPDLEDARGVVLIDEVETHLHPRWKMRVMTALRRAMPNVTFIATTHDPLCLRGMEDGEVVVLVKDEHQNIHKVNDLPDITGMRADQILTSDYFGLNSTADPRTEAELSYYVSALTRAEAGDPSAEDEANHLGQDLRQTLVLGDTAASQIAHEALRRFLDDRRELPPIERSRSRREVIERMLEALRSPLEE